MQKGGSKGAYRPVDTEKERATPTSADEEEDFGRVEDGGAPAANAIFESIDIGPFQSTAQETDKMYAAVVKALIEATKVLPKKKKHKPWFAKGHLGIQDVHEKIVKCCSAVDCTPCNRC